MNVVPIQQALFSVRAGETHWCGHLLAATPDVCSVDLDELYRWFNENKQESIFHFETGNLFFHPLPSGHFAIGKVIPRTENLFSLFHSSQTFFIQHFIISPETLLLFGNNPIALYRRIQQVDQTSLFLNSPEALQPIPLPFLTEKTRLVDQHLLGNLVSELGPQNLCMLLQLMLDSVCTFFTGRPQAVRVIEGLFNLLPVSWRTELTFSTELHFSRTKPLKMVGVSGGEQLIRLNRSDDGISYCDLSDRQHCKPPFGALLDSWPLLVFHALNRGDFAFLEEKFIEEQKKYGGMTFDDLTATNPEQLRELAMGSFAELFTRPLQKEFQPIQAMLSETDGPVEQQSQSVFLFPRVDEQTEESGITEEPSGVSDNRSFLAKVLTEATGESHFENTLMMPDLPKPDEFIPLSTLLEKKIVPLTAPAVSSRALRMKRFSKLNNEIRWLDSCVARSLFGDQTALESFQQCWNKVCKHLDSLQQIELTEGYVMLIRDFVSRHDERDAHLLLDHDIHALELLDILL